MRISFVFGLLFGIAIALTLSACAGEGSSNTTGTGAGADRIEVRFQPMQCVTPPWQEWYSQGGAQFPKAPTDEELIVAYYGSLGVDISGVRRAESAEAVCQGCEICPTAYFYEASIPGAALGTMRGWNRTREP